MYLWWRLFKVSVWVLNVRRGTPIMDNNVNLFENDLTEDNSKSIAIQLKFYLSNRRHAFV